MSAPKGAARIYEGLHPLAEPAERPSPVRLSNMIYELATEAQSIRESQSALIVSGWKEKPWAEAMRRAEVFEATVRLLERIEPVLGSVIKLIQSAEEKAAGGGSNDDKQSERRV